MVSAIDLSPTDAVSPKAVVGLAQCVVWHARELYVTQSCSVVSSTSALSASGFELEGNAPSVVQFEGVLPEATPCVAHAPVDLDG